MREAATCEAVLRWLVSHGADLNFPDERGCTALDTGVWVGAPRPLLQTLIAMGARARGANDAGDTLLHVALRKGDRSFVRELVKMSCDLEAVNKRGEAPL